MDTMWYVNRNRIKFQSLVPMNTKQHNEYYCALNQILRHYANLIAGVDYDDDEDIESDDEQYLDNKDDKSKDQLGQYEQIEEQLEQTDPDKSDDIIQDSRQNINPNVHEGNNNTNEQHLDNPAEQHETVKESTRRRTQETRPFERLETKMSGKLHVQQKKKVIFKSEDVDMQLEYCHNLVTQTQPNEGQSKEYSPSDAMLMARLIYDLNTRIVSK
jgi:hypothetical protein